MRILLTGAAGFIGSHALRTMHDRNPSWTFVVVDGLHYAAALDRIRWARESERVTFLNHDLSSPFTDYLVRAIGELDYIVHFAAETHVDRSYVNPEAFVRSNILGTFNLLEYARTKQPRLKMFFQVSTDEVYGPAAPGTHHREGAPHRPSNPYSATKAAAEDLCFAWEHSMGVPVITTNCMNVCGEMQNPEKYIPKILRALQRGEAITVHGIPGSPGSRKYLYVVDHADAILFLMQHGRRGEHYNIVGEEEVDNLEMVRRLERILGVEAKIRFIDFHSSRPGHDSRYSLDGSKMAKMGWTPRTSTDEALKRIVAWTSEHPEWA